MGGKAGAERLLDRPQGAHRVPVRDSIPSHICTTWIERLLEAVLAARALRRHRLPQPESYPLADGVIALPVAGLFSWLTS